MLGPDVYLNIYKINGSPDWCAPCGLYHTSVQIGDLEYSFGEGAGVTCSLQNPRLDGVHSFQDGTYEYSLHMGTCTLSGADLSNAISSLQRAFPGTSYDLVSRNCNHFSDALLKAVVGKGIPSHINRASRYGQWFSCLLPEEWRGNAEAEGEGQQPRTSHDLCGIFGGNGHRLGGREVGGIGEMGYRFLGRVLRLGDCLRTPATVIDSPGSDGCRSSQAFLAQAAQERMQRQLSQKASSLQ
ncbi:hypothetical protein ACSSS7_006549 [Eimeria intestinalis]